MGNKTAIGDHCKIQNNVSVHDNMRLEQGVFSGPSTVFNKSHNPRALVERKDEYLDTQVKLHSEENALQVKRLTFRSVNLAR